MVLLFFVTIPLNMRLTRSVKTPRRFQSKLEVFSTKICEKTSPPAFSSAAVAAFVSTCRQGKNRP